MPLEVRGPLMSTASSPTTPQSTITSTNINRTAEHEEEEKHAAEGQYYSEGGQTGYTDTQPGESHQAGYMAPPPEEDPRSDVESEHESMHEAAEDVQDAQEEVNEASSESDRESAQEDLEEAQEEYAEEREDYQEEVEEEED